MVRPKQRGFDYQYGAMIGELDYFTHEEHGVLDWYRDNKPVREKGYTTTLIGQDAVTISGKDAADPLHAEGVEFGGAQCADAGAAVDVDPVGHRPQDLLVPDGRRHLEIAVDDADDRRAGEGGLINLALLDRRTPFERRVVGAEGRGQ